MIQVLMTGDSVTNVHNCSLFSENVNKYRHFYYHFEVKDTDISFKAEKPVCQKKKDSEQECSPRMFSNTDKTVEPSKVRTKYECEVTQVGDGCEWRLMSGEVDVSTFGISRDLIWKDLERLAKMMQQNPEEAKGEEEKAEEEKQGEQELPLCASSGDADFCTVWCLHRPKCSFELFGLLPRAGLFRFEVNLAGPKIRSCARSSRNRTQTDGENRGIVACENGDCFKFCADQRCCHRCRMKKPHPACF